MAGSSPSLKVFLYLCRVFSLSFFRNGRKNRLKWAEVHTAL
ncbi:hypothetical protein predicted by Glimmer/Critica [Acetobacter senegalensis]|uniref:Uncharacterized protein n=1 Tax=Acetobacter senegalensis TaxID=446692 RepID=A0A0U5EVL3_9PROT|nr:hypothetical protein predicted by Glimmer/Critica [Acetobacter senegalensis]